VIGADGEVVQVLANLNSHNLQSTTIKKEYLYAMLVHKERGEGEVTN
jgi:hypothetical protein